MKRDLPLAYGAPRASITVATRAIDVGYANTKYTLGRKVIFNEAMIETGTFPSIAASIPRSRKLEYKPGDQASDGCLTEIDGALYFAGKGVAMHLKGSQPRHVLADYSTTPNYLALMHGAMHYMLEDAGNPQELVIEHLALGLPLNNYSEYRTRLVELAKGTHFIGSVDSAAGTRTVRVLNAYVLMQPFGALANLGLTQGLGLEGWNLVIDVGGGTVDYLVSRDRQPNLTRSGAHSGSMLECAHAVAKEIDPGLVKNYQIVEEIDQAIRLRAETFEVAGRTYYLANYAAAIDAVLRTAYEAMLANVGDFADFRTILICGGGAEVFHSFLVRHVPSLERRIKMDAGAIFSNVRGFHIAAEAISEAASAAV
ncbi:MAG: ParM/StbA family protein [Hydrogenophaga sp.]|uniref:ParM/StbA family protein n=1 Tax=Hydrogenophaga sp. TaxID=1904254 RepID=UPI002625378B|nr:ParM/StbA family protein [Hydrogenophaga sp.]MCV0438960.1 ParM/StbA family protein [Hydrogenophaga sp.]